ncbi:MAG: tetratricopeptide repeat protein [Chloroflexi bacterium]|nr:tetratricopeptide repeat protein [Chloroflexota bacterium]
MQLFHQPPPDEAENRFKQGLHYRDRKKKEFDFDLAVGSFKEAIRLNPEIERYHRELGKTYVAAPLLAVSRGIGNGLALGKYLGLAIGELNRALELDFSQTETHLVLGEVHMYLGDDQKATECFQAAIVAASAPFSFLSPSSFIDGLLLKSYIKRRLKHLKQGKNRKADPKMAETCLEQAVIYRNEEQYELADKQLLMAFQFAPDWAWLHKTICKLVSGGKHG